MMIIQLSDGQFALELRNYEPEKSLEDQVLFTALDAKKKNPDFFKANQVAVYLVDENSEGDGVVKEGEFNLSTGKTIWK